MQHHAYFFEGPLSAFNSYKEYLQPFWAKEFEQFGIDDARELVRFTSLKNYTEALFLIGAASITSEAQQALLKLFEEPQQGSTFLLIVPHGVLLSTLRSRCLPYPHLCGTSDVQHNAGAFLSWGYKQRSDWIAGFLKEEEGVRERVREFVNGLEAELYKEVSTKETRDGLQDIAHFRQYLSDRSPSLKMILEHFAATLPRFDLSSGSPRSNLLKP